ncbi:MAG: MATE family efflux transporter [Clostridia bacterium]|nr:MATE family efflux transporter [Clostridia bacterium]
MQTALMRFRKKWFGDRAFYKMILLIVIPIMIQNAVSAFVNLLDNVMVGQIGTDEMTGVSIVNQLMFIIQLVIFGGMSGAGIFTAQYHGAGKPEGVRHCLRFKILLSVFLTAVSMLVLISGAKPLIGLYLNEANDPARMASTLKFGEDYLFTSVFGIFPLCMAMTYASTLRETGETRLPMVASIIAVVVNLVLNAVLIYGLLGLPRMGVRGAALATVIARFIEMLYLMAVTHRSTDRFGFAIGTYRSLYIPLELVKRVILKGMPLMFNEALWSLAFATVNQCYSRRGLDVVSANNICGTVDQLFNIAFLACSAGIGIVMGKELGAGNKRQARDYCWKLIMLTSLMGLVTGLMMMGSAPFVPKLYNTEAQIRTLAMDLILIRGAFMVFFALTNANYFIIRSGGRTMLTLLFDSGFVWLMNVPLAFCLAEFTAMPVLMIFTLVQTLEIVKGIAGLRLVKSDFWMQNIVS